MPMQILSSKPVIEKMEVALRERIQKFHARAKRFPKLSVILVGGDPASVIYTTNKGNRAVSLGMEHESIHLPGTASAQEVLKEVRRLNQDRSVDGILIQRPLPTSGGFREEEVVYWVSPEKDVDAFHPENAGRLALGLPCFLPCTPAGVMKILDHYDISVAGKTACVIGRSSIVGKPMAALLLRANATVIQAHSQTLDLVSMTRQADILVVAAGKIGLIGREHIKPGAVVVDVGIHRNDEGKIVGDVRAHEMPDVASAFTPVPGGVGPMTIAVLMKNTVLAAEKRG